MENNTDNEIINNTDNTQEAQNIEQTPAQENKKLLTSILDGSFLTSRIFLRQLPFIFFLGLLALIYITVRNHSEKTLISYTLLHREVRELRAESISIASELMFISKQSEVYKAVTEKNLGLIEASEPPKKIIIKKNQKYNF